MIDSEPEQKHRPPDKRIRRRTGNKRQRGKTPTPPRVRRITSRHRGQPDGKPLQYYEPNTD